MRRWWRRHRRRCLRGHTWAPWVIDRAHRTAIRECLFCPATQTELLAE